MCEICCEQRRTFPRRNVDGLIVERTCAPCNRIVVDDRYDFAVSLGWSPSSDQILQSGEVAK